MLEFVDKYFLVDLVEYLRIKSIKKQIPKSISNRISNMSSNNERFGQNINVYKENLKKVAFMMIRFVWKNHLLNQKATDKAQKNIKLFGLIVFTQQIIRNIDRILSRKVASTFHTLNVWELKRNYKLPLIIWKIVCKVNGNPKRIFADVVWKKKLLIMKFPIKTYC